MSQVQKIKHHLEFYGSITPMEALNDYGCFRLAPRINELRIRGIGIKTTMEKKNGKRYARYTFAIAHG